MSNKPGGFSLAELVLSLGLLTVAMVMLSSLFVGLYRGSDKSGNQSTGLNAAETVLNQQIHDIFKGTHPTLTKAAFFASNSPPGLSGSLTLSSTEFLYQFDYVTVQSNLGTDLGVGLSGNRLKAVTVTCWWWGQAANSHRAGLGKLSVQLRRLVNENDQY